MSPRLIRAHPKLHETSSVSLSYFHRPSLLDPYLQLHMARAGSRARTIYQTVKLKELGRYYSDLLIFFGLLNESDSPVLANLAVGLRSMM